MTSRIKFLAWSLILVAAVSLSGCDWWPGLKQYWVYRQRYEQMAAEKERYKELYEHALRERDKLQVYVAEAKIMAQKYKEMWQTAERENELLRDENESLLARLERYGRGVKRMHE